jgi:hypothetical protein
MSGSSSGFDEPVRGRKRRHSTASLLAACLLAATALAGCGAIQPARMALPGGLEGRGGTVRFEDLELSVRSVHDLQGSPIPLAAPIGYLFEAGGRPVGAVEVNGDPAVVFLPDAADPRARRAVLYASIALALLWDPANR